MPPPKKDNKEQQREDPTSLTSTLTELLTTKLAEHKRELLAEIRDTHARYEAKLDSFQTSVEDHNKRITSLEQFANSTSTDMGVIQAQLATMATANAKLRAKVSDLEGRSRRNNIRIVGLPENIERSTTPTEFFSNLLCEVLGTDILPSPPELDRAHRTLAARPSSTDRPRPVVIAFHSYKTREKVVIGARKLRGKLRYRDAQIHIFEDYSPEVLEQRTPYRSVMRRLHDMGLKPALRYPAKLFIVLSDGTKKFLPSVDEATEFANSLDRRGAGPSS